MMNNLVRQKIGGGRVFKLMGLIVMMAWLEILFMPSREKEEDDQAPGIVLDNCTGPTCYLG